MALTAAEQFLIELINRARLDPVAEAARQGIDLNKDVAADQLISADAKQVLAPNEFLNTAAEGHSIWMLDNDVFQHVGAGGSSAFDRMAAAGYQFVDPWVWAENISLQVSNGLIDQNAAIVTHFNGLFQSEGHRRNTLDDRAREIGVAQVGGEFTDDGTFFNAPGTTFNASMLTENFAASGATRFVTGVAYDDTDQDGFYAIGEGRSGVTFTVNGAQDTTGAAGGYAIGSNSTGPQEVTIETGSVSGVVNTSLADGNVKIDVVNGTDLLTSGDLTLVAGFTSARLIGVADLDLTGAETADTLIGNTGNNRLVGGPGNDTLKGGDGQDVLLGGAGNNLLDGGAGQDVARFDFAFGDSVVMALENSGFLIASLGTADQTTVLDVETLAFTDRSLTPQQAVAQLELTGLALAGGAGDDVLEGGVGADFLTGGGGNDVLRGFGGDDTLLGGDGADTLNAGDGDDTIIGGTSVTDLRDVVFAGAGNDFVDGGHGNDDLKGMGGDDTLAGGFGADTLIGGFGDDVINGGPLSDLVFGGPGNDFVNGGFGFDRVNGGAGADRFFHLGIESHGSDWIRDFTQTEGDVLLFGQADATFDQFQVNVTNTPGAGDDAIDEAFIIYKPTGQIVWALVDGMANTSIDLQIAGSADTFDLLA